MKTDTATDPVRRPTRCQRTRLTPLRRMSGSGSCRVWTRGVTSVFPKTRPGLERWLGTRAFRLLGGICVYVWVWVCFVVFGGRTLTAGDEPVWHTDYAAAAQLAKETDRSLLLLFTGSDWCGPCLRLKQEALSKPEFLAHAKEHWVLVEVDFPVRKAQSGRLKHQNRQLKTRYNIGGYPTLVLLKADGSEVGRVEGYVAGGADAVIRRLSEKLSGK